MSLAVVSEINTFALSEEQILEKELPLVFLKSSESLCIFLLAIKLIAMATNLTLESEGLFVKILVFLLDINKY